MFNIDFSWAFKGKYLNDIVNKYKAEFQYVDISDPDSVNKKVGEIFNEYRKRGTWSFDRSFEKDIKQAIRSSLIDAKMKHIVNATTILHLHDNSNVSKKTLKNLRNSSSYILDHCSNRDKLFKSLNNVTENELQLINKHRHTMYDIFEKSKVIRSFTIFRGHSSKLSDVARHISNEFIKIKSNEKQKEKYEKHMAEIYPRYEKSRTFNNLSFEERRECDECVISELKKQLNQCQIALDVKDVKTQGLIQKLVEIKNDKPDRWEKDQTNLWKERFTHEERKFLERKFPVLGLPLKK